MTVSIPLTLLFYWDSVPNPDAPRGLCVLHVFAVANTRTRLSQSPYPPFQGGTSGLRAHQSACHRFAVLRPASDDALLVHINSQTYGYVYRKRLRGYVLTGLLLFVKTILKCLDCGQRKSRAIRPAFSLPIYLEGDFCMLRPGSR